MAGGFEHGAINTLKHNRTILKKSKARYSKVKKQYLGKGLSNHSEDTFPKLTAQELAEGRLRAKLYYKRRNRKIFSLIVLLILVALSLVIYAIVRLLG